jgi:hypothetical protein
MLTASGMAGAVATFDLHELETLRQSNKEFLVVVVGAIGERTFKIKRNASTVTMTTATMMIVMEVGSDCSDEQL